MIGLVFNLATPFVVLAVLIYSHRKAQKSGLFDLFLFEINRSEEPKRFKRRMLFNVVGIIFMATGCLALIVTITTRLISLA